MIRGYAITAVVSGALGAAAAVYFAPERVRTEFRDRVVTVTVRDTQRVKTRTETRPDGTRVTERTETVSRSDSSTDRRTVTTPPPRWHAGALLIAQPRLRPLGADLYAGVLVSRQLVGPISVGLTATVPVANPISLPAVGVTLGVSW